MVVLQAYKKTEVGIIPNDWNCIPLYTLGDLLSGLTYTPENIRQYGLLVLRSSNIQNGRLSFEDNVYVNCEVSDNKYVQPGDLLICVRNGSRSLIGKCALIDKNYHATFGAFMSLFRSAHGKYLYQLFSSNAIQKQINKNCGATINQITGADFKKILIAFPQKSEEQAAIAKALSDVDSLIFSLQKLIDKKKAIKQGVMQELLTGKKRLKGFSGEWKNGSWQDILNCFSSGATPYRGTADYYKGHIKWVSSGELNYNIIMDTLEHITEQAKIDASLTLHPAGTFLMAITGLEAAGTRGSCAILGVPATTNQSCMAIYGTENMVTSYLYHYYILNGEKLAFEYCQGTKQQSYTAAIVKELPIYYPSNIKEQRAIAQILSDMDTEIEQLEKKLTKYHQIKQGVMHELLTGRIRLLDTETLVQPATQKSQATIELPTHKPHNQQFDDAVIIAGIVNAFYSDKFPLGRKKVQKLLYLMRRKEQADTSAFHKKAAGPYADEVRYKGGEPIAKKNEYIQINKNDKGSRFARGKKIEQALAYLEDWGKQPDMDWLVSQFQFTSVNELELLATVDMAICDLHQEGKRVSVHAIKELISSTKEWREKLNKTYFKDSDIQRAIKKCEELFGTE